MQMRSMSILKMDMLDWLDHNLQVDGMVLLHVMGEGEHPKEDW
jgi:hypothetical protein